MSRKALIAVTVWKEIWLPTFFNNLRFRQLRSGLFGPDPENKVNVNWLIWNLILVIVCIKLVNTQNFKPFWPFCFQRYDVTKILSRRERVIAIRYLPPGIKQNSKKITFYAWKHLFRPKIIPPSAFPWFSSETKKFICSIFWKVSFQKQLKQLPWWIDFVKILPKCD